LASRPGTDIQPTWSVRRILGGSAWTSRASRASGRICPVALVRYEECPPLSGGSAACRQVGRPGGQAFPPQRSRSSAVETRASTASRGSGACATIPATPTPSTPRVLNRNASRGRAHSRRDGYSRSMAAPDADSTHPQAGAELDDQVTGAAGNRRYRVWLEHRTAPPMDNRACGCSAPTCRGDDRRRARGGHPGRRPSPSSATHPASRARTRRVPSVSAGRPGLTRGG
jgi:hypothetical protein